MVLGENVGFYDLSKEERKELVGRMEKSIKSFLERNADEKILKYASDDDFYIRKNTYLILGRIYRENENLRNRILNLAQKLLKNENVNVRQTAVYIFGEIGKIDALNSWKYLEIALNDDHHVVKNAVMGAIKIMGQKNPELTLEFAKKFIHSEDPEVRRIMTHGIELRGKTHPQEILPLLEKMQDEETKKVRKMVIHVLSQTSYKERCLETVIGSLKKMEK